MSEAAPGLSIVVPVYNGAATVGRLVEALSGLSVDGGLEIVLVYDGSPDNSLAVCRALAEIATVPVTVVEHSRNYGEHNAVMTGFRHARGAYIITMDDDLQNPPEEVVRLYDACRLGGHEVVYTFYETKQHDSWRNLGSRFNGWVADKLLDKPKGLYLCSFRCLSAFVAEAVTAYEGPFVYVDGLILQVTQKIGTLQVRHLARAEGQSNYTLRRLINLWLAMALNFSVLPLRFATLAGAVTGGLGVLGLLAVLIEGLFGHPPEGWASIAAIVLTLGGLQLLMLGIVGEYVGRLFLTVNKRPQGVVKSVTRGGPGA
ncbi:glycosyl transferase [Elstera cyanobacteriorum]|uniref:Glycosyltransferase n=1 Tax=Elstera cyanobacteriorum TaxID=2022747 RepID=A0A255XPI0_9PROT|nr:glycosyltransferase family 2 protein [Elstera cyanobacteriorum]OYQ18812.1 glycosyltransferase [Elstera cyanobacteriorum]GFZ77525.1 glycosyl transferase [Elstera cyanobacteriorum]